MFDESRFAFFKSREADVAVGADNWLCVLANNHHLASEVFGDELGALNAGSMADLIVLDYHCPTPLTSENLAWHLAFGMNSAAVDSVMVNGRFVIRDRRSALDEQNLYDRARAASEELWRKLQSL
jgi:cytosine/adenosine deaminase-related metal-dependent hydrolase